jgi:hypothetical protein
MPRVRRRRCTCCKSLFRADPRVGPRQRTCGAPACQRQRHAASCRRWRRRNRAVTRTHFQDYVQPSRARAAPKAISPRQVTVFLRGLRPEMRDAILAQPPPRCGVRSP